MSPTRHYFFGKWYGAVIAVLLMCADGAMAQSRFTYNSAGDEVTDTRSGLVWKRCSEGQTWDGNTCTGSATGFSHEGALVHAQSQAGSAGWRLPNVKELSSLADKSRANPAIDVTAFPATPSRFYWTATPDANASPNAWVVGFDYGAFNLYNGLRNTALFVRLVK